MERKIVRAQLYEYGNFLNVSSVAKYLGLSRETVRTRYLSGLPYLQNGTEKLYFVEDVLDSIMGKVVSG